MTLSKNTLGSTNKSAIPSTTKSEKVGAVVEAASMIDIYTLIDTAVRLSYGVRGKAIYAAQAIRRELAVAQDEVAKSPEVKDYLEGLAVAAAKADSMPTVACGNCGFDVRYEKELGAYPKGCPRCGVYRTDGDEYLAIEPEPVEDDGSAPTFEK